AATPSSGQVLAPPPSRPGARMDGVSTSNLIVIAAVAAVVLVVAVVVGVVLYRRRRISLRRPEETKETGYRTESKISLAGPAATTAPSREPDTEAPETEAPAHPVEERTEVEGQPAVGDDAAVPRDSQPR